MLKPVRLRVLVALAAGAVPLLSPAIAAEPLRITDCHHRRPQPGAAGGPLSLAYYAYSTDNGTTWSRNTRVSDRSVDRRIGPFAQNFDLLSPPGLLSTNAFALLAWEDTRNGNPVTQTQDIYAAVGRRRRAPVG